MAAPGLGDPGCGRIFTVSGELGALVGGVDSRLVALVDAFALRTYPAVLEQHELESVFSPLGVWLLLAACAIAARGADRVALEDALGCSGQEAGELVQAFVSQPPAALKAALGLWVREEDAGARFLDWVRALPADIDMGMMPSQEQADEWARRKTLGLIKRFPGEIGPMTRIVLASAIATKVSWRDPFGVLPADQSLGPGSPWRRVVERVLWRSSPDGIVGIVDTDAAGQVAVYGASAVDEVTVVSVSADPGIPRDAVITAAHEAIAMVRERPFSWVKRSLFDLPLGDGHSWHISEREIPTDTPDARYERVDQVTLPQWRVEGEIDLLRSDRFGCGPAVAAVQAVIGPEPDDEFAATQAAVAAFTRLGFEAAAVTAISVAVGAAAPVPLEHRGIERAATLRFDHPYVAVALVGTAQGNATSRWAGLPLFTVWVTEPAEPTD